MFQNDLWAADQRRVLRKLGAQAPGNQGAQHGIHLRTRILDIPLGVQQGDMLRLQNQIHPGQQRFLGGVVAHLYRRYRSHPLPF